MKKENIKQISDKSAAVRVEPVKTRDEKLINRMLFVPYLQESLDRMKYKFVKGDTQKWIPVPCSLLVRPEFVAQTTQTRYIFMSILLLCGALGSDEISANTKYLANVLAADERTVAKAIEELLFSNLLVEQNRKEENKTEKKIKENNPTQQNAAAAAVKDAPPETAAAVCVDLNSFKQKTAKAPEKNAPAGDGHLSKFTLEQCLSYAQLCAFRGGNIKNPHGLAMSLYQTGKSDAYIRAELFPEEQEKADLETYGEPVCFSDQPCSKCFGAKMCDADGKGFQKCDNCRDERGKSTGLEPEGENKNDSK